VKLEKSPDEGAPALRTPEQLKPVSSYLPAELSAIFVTANTPQERAQHFQGAADLVLRAHTARNQSAIQRLPVRPRISLIRLTMRDTADC